MNWNYWLPKHKKTLQTRYGVNTLCNMVRSNTAYTNSINGFKHSVPLVLSLQHYCLCFHSRIDICYTTTTFVVTKCFEWTNHTDGKENIQWGSGQHPVFDTVKASPDILVVNVITKPPIAATHQQGYCARQLWLSILCYIRALNMFFIFILFLLLWETLSACNFFCCKAF